LDDSLNLKRKAISRKGAKERQERKEHQELLTLFFAAFALLRVFA
jgi:hypothetical protein